MDNVYLERKNPKKSLLLIIIILLLLSVGLYLFLQGQKKLVSPVPSKPSFELIFYTPTPGETIPTSTPSATPKVKKTGSPTGTPKPTFKISITPTAKPTVKTTPSPTI
jgi:hypothetical protein